MEASLRDGQDIVAFADPYTEPKVRSLSKLVRVDLIRNGRDISFDIDPATGKVTSRHRRRTFVSTSSLLASEEFSNLARFSQTQMRAQQKSAAASSPIIPANVVMDGKRIRAADLVAAIVQTNERLRLILLDGPAGVGKTYQVDQISAMQATKFIDGEATPPVLVVSSRGRRLSNLPDVLAASTQEFAASFGARQVPILVRRGLLIVAIDGFDELVDADGYEDAWSALRLFLAEVGGGGTVILAARDTFVEEQELLHRIDRTRSDIALSIGHIQPIDPADAKEWLSKSPHWKPSELNTDIANEVLSEGSYALRPFFLQEIRDAKGWADIVDVGPRTYLVNRYIRRESNLLAQQLGGVTADAISPALTALMQEVALEMGSRESDSVETEHLGFLTQYCFEGVLEERSIRKLSHKAGSFALLELSSDKGKRKFPHSEIQHYYFGGALVNSLSEHVIPSVLRRGLLGAEQLEVISEVLIANPKGSQGAIDNLVAMASSEISGDGFGSNAGSLLILAFAMGLVERVDYFDVIEATMAGGSPKGVISESTIGRLDACGANMSAVDFISTRISTLIVDESTVLGASIPSVDSIEIKMHGATEVRRSPQDVAKFLSSNGSRVEGDDLANNDAARLLDKIARRSVRHFYLRDSSDEDGGATLLQDALWPRLKDVLIQHSRIDIRRGKQMHGRPAPMIRVRNPRELLDRSNPETVAILTDLQKN